MQMPQLLSKVRTTGLVDDETGLLPLRIPVRTYQVEGDRGANTRYGIFADDMAKAGLHACVVDGQLDNNGVVALLVKAVQNLSAQVRELQGSQPSRVVCLQDPEAAHNGGHSQGDPEHPAFWDFTTKPDDKDNKIAHLFGGKERSTPSYLDPRKFHAPSWTADIRGAKTAVCAPTPTLEYSDVRKEFWEYEKDAHEILVRCVADLNDEMDNPTVNPTELNSIAKEVEEDAHEILMECIDDLNDDMDNPTVNPIKVDSIAKDVEEEPAKPKPPVKKVVLGRATRTRK
jgi:hypothetical protein